MNSKQHRKAQVLYENSNLIKQNNLLSSTFSLLNLKIQSWEWVQIKKLKYVKVLKNFLHYYWEMKSFASSKQMCDSNTTLKYLLFLSNFTYLGMCPYSGTTECGNALKGTPNILP